MKPEPQPEALALGARLKRVRELAGLSQRELAKRAGVPNSSVSTIEQGQVSPSVQSLGKLLAAVPISLSQFFADDHTYPGVRVAGPRQWVPLPQLRGLRRHRLAEGRLITERWTLPAGVDTGQAPMTLLADTSGTVISGTFRLTVGLQVFDLEAGGGYYLEAGKRFRLQNPTDTDAVLVLSSLASGNLDDF